jgi:hypothetical protein
LACERAKRLARVPRRSSILLERTLIFLKYHLQKKSRSFCQENPRHQTPDLHQKALFSRDLSLSSRRV